MISHTKIEVLCHTFSIIQEDAVPGLGIKYLHSDSVLMGAMLKWIRCLSSFDLFIYKLKNLEKMFHDVLVFFCHFLLFQKLLRFPVSHFSHLWMEIMEIVITYKDAHFSHFNVSVGEISPLQLPHKDCRQLWHYGHDLCLCKLGHSCS